MSIKSKVDWLRGFLESLEYGDTISQKQIKILKEKLNQLLEEFENNFSDEEDEEDLEINVRIPKINVNYPKQTIGDEDLPF